VILVIVGAVIALFLIGALVIDHRDRKAGRKPRSSKEIMELVRDGRRQARSSRRGRRSSGRYGSNPYSGPYPGADTDGDPF
jgi:hypothetical protein